MAKQKLHISAKTVARKPRNGWDNAKVVANRIPLLKKLWTKATKKIVER